MIDDRIINDAEDRRPETATSRENKLKKERIPLYKQQALVYTDKEPGWHYRFVNDEPGRINKFLKAGWELVKGNVEDTYSGKGRKEASSQGSYVKRIVDPNHTYTDALLMRIPLELWMEDQRAKDANLDKMEEDLDGGGQLRNARRLGNRSNLNIK